MMKKFSSEALVTALIDAARVPMHRTMQKHFHVIARSDSDEAIHISASATMDCFASLAMTGGQNANARDKPGHDAVFVDLSAPKIYA
jgi:hypothetical protein